MGSNPSDEELARTATAVVDSGVRKPAPARLGKYTLEGELGAGGMGVVHAAFDPDLERRVAIKLLKDAGADTSRARLLREARAMARLSHPNVVMVHEVGTIDGRDFVAMELVDGQSIAEWLRASQRSREEILDVFVAAGHGLAAAHAEGLVHRDFKPHNVLRNKKGRVVVTDFGLARGVDATIAITVPLVGPIVGDGTPNLPLLTATGAVVGTPAYMAPEQWKGDGIGPATDQFAYCVALWEALSGERPFKGNTGEELRAAVEKGPSSLDVSRIPRRFRGLLQRGLDAHPARRWASMDVLLAAITRARRRPLLPILLGVGVMIFALAAIAIITSHRPAAPAPSPTTPADPTPVASLPLGDHDALVASITALADNDFEVPRATVDQILANGNALFGKDARLVNTISAREPLGYKVYVVKPGGIFAALHLQNGDTLTAIDNISITGDKRAEIEQAVRARDHVVVDLLRKGQGVRLAITIK